MELEKKENKNIGIKVLVMIDFILLIVLTVLVLMGVTQTFDERITNAILDIRNSSLTKVMLSITNLGGGYALTALSVLLIFILKNKKRAIFIFSNLVIVFLTSQLFKIIFVRNRPNVITLIGETGYSYPSGHMMVSSAFYLYISYLICKYTKNKVVKIFSVIIALVLIFVIGFSRLYLGVHYLTDIIGGLLFALLYLYFFIGFSSKLLGGKK